eukprot:6095230-Alexandrium_andersonii.AAC.1
MVAQEQEEIARTLRPSLPLAGSLIPCTSRSHPSRRARSLTWRSRCLMTCEVCALPSHGASCV